MANTDIIDEVVSSQAYKDVLQFTEAIDALEKKFVEAAQAADLANAAISGSKGIKELREATQKLNEENTKLTGVEKELANIAAKRAIAESALGKQLAEEKVLLQQLNKENANRAKLQVTEAGSIARLEAVRDKLLAKQKGLNRETEEGAKKNDLYVKSLDRINERIKTGRDSRTQQAQNVGNYQGSAKLIVEALEKEKRKLEELQELRSKQVNVQNAGAQPFNAAASTGFNVGRTQISGFSRGNDLSSLNKQIEQSQKNVAALQKVTSQPTFLKLAGEVGDSNKEFKSLQKTLIELERNGQGDTDFANTLRKDLAEMKDSIADTKDEIKALSSDTRGLDLFAGSISFAADTFQAAAGAAQLFGASEEDAAEATRTLVAIQSVSNGVKGIANELTTRGTAANKVYAFTQGLVSTAFDKSATSAKRFQAALGLIGLLVTVIGAVVVAIGEMNRELSEAEKTQQALNDVIKDSAADFGKAKTEVAQMGIEIGLAKKGLIDKEVVLKKFNETIGETIGQTNDLGTAEKLLNDKKDKYIEMMFAKSQAAAAFALANKAAEESVKNEAATTDELLGTFDKISAMFKGITVKSLFTVDTKQLQQSAEIANKIAEQNRADKRTEYQDKYNRFLQIGNAKLSEAGQISTDNNFKTKEQLDLEKEKADEAKKAADKASADANKAADERKKIADDLAKFNKRQTEDELKARQQLNQQKNSEAANVFKRIADDEAQTLDKRLAANGFYYGSLEKQVKQQADYEKEQLLQSLITEKEGILQRKLTRSEVEEVYKQSADRIKGIEAKAETDITEIHRNGLENQRKLIEQATARRFDDLAKASSKRIAELDTAEALELQNLEVKYNNGNISFENAEKEKLKIQRQYALLRLKEELDAAEQVLRIRKASGDNVVEAEREVERIKLEILRQGNIDVSNEEAKSLELFRAAVEEKKALYQELGNELKNAVFGFIDAGFERQKNAIEQDKILIDERRDAELKRINALQIAESEKADKIKILDANVQAQKEQLARRQKQIDIQRARAEKVSAVFGIGINIAQREVEALKYLTNPLTAPLYPGIAALIAGIGAIQLAAVLSRPIPEYWTGTDDSKGGLVWLGERGREGLITPDGQMFETPGTATLANIPAHSKVINNTEYERMIRDKSINSIYNSPNPEDSRAFYEWQANRNEAKLQQVIDAINNKKETVLNIDPWGVSAFGKQGQSWQEYMDKKVRFKNE